MNNTGTPDPDRTLKVKYIPELKYHFRIPAYQRGYRWERKQVRQLLDDIENSSERFYYIQPIVVAPNDSEGLDLIDGQQRLTTILLIYKILNDKKQGLSVLGTTNPLNAYDLESPYELIYQTREDKVRGFFNDLDTKPLESLFEEARSFPDTLYMWHAAKQISEWIDEDFMRMPTLAKALETKVKVIWYELSLNIDCWEKFADLNVGKIPLTNSELIKALFLREDKKPKDAGRSMSDHDKSVIVDQWDSIERELNNDLFWNFLTNRKKEEYDTKIDLLFDIITGKKANEKDDFYTFFEFEKRFSDPENGIGKEKWNEIYLQYLRLRDWYDDPTNELYHKVGYLVSIADKEEVLYDLFKISQSMTHAGFIHELDTRIQASILLPAIEEGDNNLAAEARIRLKELNYNNHQPLIHRILTLFNVLTVQSMADKTRRYSFHHHKNVNGGWSLEHIHAQKSETLNTEKQWTEWIYLHQKSLKRFLNTLILDNASQESIEAVKRLDAEMTSFLALKPDDRSQIAFTRISRAFAQTVVSGDIRTSPSYKDEMANMALLGKNDNSMLNNSVFDVKRGLILKSLSRSFIPPCTQKVFLKAYTRQDESQFFFWGKNDRDAYIDSMEEMLLPYLPQGYVTEKELRNRLDDDNEF